MGLTIKKHIGVFLLILLGAFQLFHGSALAESDHPYYFTPKVGVSAFTGIVGFENQFNHWALDIGIPLSGGVRYYFRPSEHSWFAGIYGRGYGYDHDETKDNIPYHHFSTISEGVGGGYRWFWHERWSLELGLAVGYFKDRWKGDYAERTETGIRLLPVASFGFSF